MHLSLKTPKRLLSLAAVALAPLLGGCAEVQVRTQIEIAAPAATVWAILTDFERYPERNPYPVSMVGEPVLGATLDLHLRRPDGKQLHIEPHILRLEPLRELTWGGGVPGVFYGEHVLRIEPLGPQQVRRIHDEDFSDFAVGFADLPPATLTEGCERMNRALKARAESEAAATRLQREISREASAMKSPPELACSRACMPG